MTLSMQLWMLAGVLVMSGVTCVVWWLVPAQPDLADALRRLAPTNPLTADRRTTPEVNPDVTGRVGRWAATHLPTGWVKVPVADLAIVGKPVHVFYGEKVLQTLIVVTAAPILCWIFSLTLSVPIVVPVSLTLVAGGLAWMLPNATLTDTATKARVEFRRGLASYLDLVALERNAGGAGTRQALENAARVADGWVFRRLADALGRSKFVGVPPWDALHDLAIELRLPELDELGDVMRLAGEEGAQVVDTLRARSTALRSAILTTDQATANAVGERMTVPATGMALMLAATLIAPALLRLTTG